MYAPTANADDEERDAFYGKLQETLDSVPKADVLIVLGDMNAKIGEEGGSHSAGKHGLGCRNEAGNRLLEFCASNDLKIMNTSFKQPKKNLYTWTSPGGRYKNSIDFIMIKQRWASTIQSTIRPRLHYQERIADPIMNYL